jgi:UDP-N-acetylmuramate--alanine ligase
MEIKLEDIRKVYFIGIGGIGMSAIARYFLGRNCTVFGYDKTETSLTKQLVSEGMQIHYTDDVRQIPEKIDLVVITPAVPKNHGEWLWFQEHGYPILKRSEVLGIISRGMKCIAVAGTHGKTTTSSIVTHILREGGLDVTAFLGGISKSLGSNFVQGKSDWMVVEADEFDRSFLRLSPDLAIITAIDPDHLDIYGTERIFRKGFIDFTKKMKPQGKIIKNTGVSLKLSAIHEQNSVVLETYGVSRGKYKAVNMKVRNGFFVFNYESPLGNISNLQFGLPGKHNVENATAAVAIAQHLGIEEGKIRSALLNFKGIGRRFEFIVRNKKTVFIDDYAHHPTELESAIAAARALYPKKEITGIFQPHLFTRTRDFLEGFAQALDKLDRIILLDIYPAREQPIEGVDADLLYKKLKNFNKMRANKENLLEKVKEMNFEVLLTLGAGDIDTFVQPIGKMLLERAENSN